MMFQDTGSLNPPLPQTIETLDAVGAVLSANESPPPVSHVANTAHAAAPEKLVMKLVPNWPTSLSLMPETLNDADSEGTPPETGACSQNFG